MIEQDSDEEDDEPTLRIHGTPAVVSGAADDDILPISGLLLGSLKSSVSVSNVFGGESGRYGEEEHIYRSGGPADYEDGVRRDAERELLSDYMVIDSKGRDRSVTVFEAMEESGSFPEPVCAPRGKWCGRGLM